MRGEAVTFIVGADSESPLVPAGYDIAFGAIGIALTVGMLLITCVAIVLVVRSSCAAAVKAVLIILTLALPVVGAVAALLVLVLTQRTRIERQA